MEKRNIEIHKFHIQPYGDNDTKVDLSDINNLDFYDLLKSEFADFVDTLPKDKSKKQIIKFQKKTINDNLKTTYRFRDEMRVVSGKVVTGRYGKTENVVDVDEKDNNLVFKIEKNHAVQKPFFFMICLPLNTNEGFVLLEREGLYGIKGVFTNIMRTFVSKRLNRYSIKFSKFVDDEIIKKMVTKGELNSITLTRHSLPGDIADKYGLGKFETDDFVIELKIKAKGKKKIIGNARRRVLEIFNNNPQGFFAFKGFEDIGFSNNSYTMNVSSTYNDTTRSIDLSDTMKFKPYYEIRVSINDDGHSDFDEIEKKTIQLLESLNLQII